MGHKNVIEMCSRPFDNVEDMNDALARNWNERVCKSDTVYILGDLIFGKVDPLDFLPRLKGKKILITGNHDRKWLNGGNYEKYFELVTPYLETVICNKTFTLCHYPMVEWRASRKMGCKKLGFHVHGHIHNGYRDGYRDLFLAPHALNAGVDINGFAPVTFDELVKNNETHALNMLKSPVDKALFLASKYHMYQTDKSGKPYVEHPKAVAAQLSDEAGKTVGLLHDTLEDTDISVELLEKTFAPEIVDAVKAMTHDPSEDYFDYIERVKQNDIARRVKLADLTHNMDMSRFKFVTDRDVARYEKYKKAYAILTE